jgi:hypothetical protein
MQEIYCPILKSIYKGDSEKALHPIPHAAQTLVVITNRALRLKARRSESKSRENRSDERRIHFNGVITTQLI